MSTNFYWARQQCWDGAEQLPDGVVIEGGLDRDDPQIHIGKRSAAGRYCWDCQRTLCKGGESAIHMSTHGFYERCPSCGKGPQPESTSTGPNAVELGFAEPSPIRPTGVRGCASFNWAQDKDTVLRVCREEPDRRVVTDEYGRGYTGREFTEVVLLNCPVQFTDHVGVPFS